MTLVADLFVHPISVVGFQRLLLLLPLCLAVSIVYKSIKCEKVRDIPLSVLALWATIVGGMVAVGVGLLVVYEILA